MILPLGLISNWSQCSGVMVTISLRQHSVIAFVIGGTVLSIALTGSAFAQIKPKLNFTDEKPVDPKSEAYKKEIDEKYRSTLKGIPDQSQKKVDPWGNVRGPNPSSK
jgi:hypothetical protein